MSISCKSCTIADIKAAYLNVKRGSSIQVVFYKGLKIKLTNYNHPDCKAHVYASVAPPGHTECGAVAWSFNDVMDVIKSELAYWKYAGVV